MIIVNLQNFDLNKTFEIHTCTQSDKEMSFKFLTRNETNISSKLTSDKNFQLKTLWCIGAIAYYELSKRIGRSITNKDFGEVANYINRLISVALSYSNSPIFFHIDPVIQKIQLVGHKSSIAKNCTVLTHMAFACLQEESLHPEGTKECVPEFLIGLPVHLILYFYAFSCLDDALTAIRNNELERLVELISSMQYSLDQADFLEKLSSIEFDSEEDKSPLTLTEYAKKFASMGGKAKYGRSGNEKIKKEVIDFYETRGKEFITKAAFIRDVLEKYSEEIKSDKTIERWLKESSHEISHWRKKEKSF